MVGTPLFLSPEVIKKENYDHRVDIWALGCVMYHLAALEPPFVSENIENLLKTIQFKTPKPLQGCYSIKLKEFIYKMLEKQKSKRPFITELFDMFPSSYQLIRDVDIVNYNMLKNRDEVLQKKNAIDTGIYVIDSEFKAMKNRQMEKKHVSTFASLNSTSLPDSNLKYDIRHTLQKVYNNKELSREDLNQFPKFFKNSRKVKRGEGVSDKIKNSDSEMKNLNASEFTQLQLNNVSLFLNILIGSN